MRVSAICPMAFSMRSLYLSGKFCLSFYISPAMSSAFGFIRLTLFLREAGASAPLELSSSVFEPFRSNEPFIDDPFTIHEPFTSLYIGAPDCPWPKAPDCPWPKAPDCPCSGALDCPWIEAKLPLENRMLDKTVYVIKPLVFFFRRGSLD